MALRKKTVEIDGTSFTIAPLRMGQIEEFIEVEQTANEDYRVQRERTWKVIHASLTNAAGPGATVPTLPEIKNQLTLEGYLELNQEVMQISGLRPGETTAAAATTDSTSPNSAAA